ncbi:MAG: acyl-CoA dehydrogenase family protein, partial [Mycobacterium sp.]
MNLELTQEQIALRDTVRHFLTEKASVASHVRAMLDDATGTTDDVWRGLARLGAMGVLVPQDLDGAGMTMVEAGVVAEELGAALTPGPWLSSAVAATRALTRTGARGDAVDALLAGIADGSTVATVGPLSGPMPVAEDSEGSVLLQGDITALPDAAAANVLLVLAEERAGAGLYSVDPTSGGVAVTARSHVDPTRKLFDVAFDGVAARRLADAPADAIEGLIDDVTIARAADALGAADAVMNLAVEYAKVRRQF